MEFFEQQTKTNRRSYLFFALFCLSAIVFSVVVCFIVTVLFFIYLKEPFRLWHHPISLIALGFTMGPILFETFKRLHQLKSEGSAKIIERMDVRYIEDFCDDPLERRLKNVVEEMAISSNQPRPEIYVLNEFRINAITVATAKNDICLGVSQGALENLSRDELQAMVATQFAMIINGDAKFKTHMIGWLHGISFVQQFGEKLMQNRPDQSGNDFNLLGFIFLTVGYIGYVQALWIKRLFCRQRQFLADAYAVQYTRNPDALGGVLKKSKNNSCLSMLVNTEVTHLFFAEPRPIITPMHPCKEDRLDRVYANRPGRHQDPTYPTPTKKEYSKKSKLEKPSIQSHTGDISHTIVPSNAITNFTQASDSAKSFLLRGLRAVARTDSKIEDNEIHLIQAICAAINMPLPELMAAADAAY